MDIKNILQERGNNYGDFITVANLTQHLEYVTLKHFHDVHPEGSQLPNFMKESLHMIFQKIARAVNGNPFYDDSWQDIAGYAQLVVDGIHRIEQEQLAAQQAQTQEQLTDNTQETEHV